MLTPLIGFGFSVAPGLPPRDKNQSDNKSGWDELQHHPEVRQGAIAILPTFRNFLAIVFERAPLGVIA
eukprot:3634332-Amphidinium_carterae.1